MGVNFRSHVCTATHTEPPLHRNSDLNDYNDQNFVDTTLTAAAAIVLYLAVATIFGFRLFGRLDDTHALKRIDTRIFLIVAIVAVVLHTFTLYRQLVGIDDGGLNFGFFNAISLMTLLVSALVIGAAFTKPLESLCVVVLPAAAVALVLDAMFSSSHVLLAATATELRYHIIVSIMAYSTLSIAAVQALMLAVQNHYLRRKHPGGFIRAFPPLETMELLLFQMIGAGFVLLTLSLATGLPQIEDMFAQHQAHKTILSIMAWSFFAVLLWGRWRFGWRGRTAVRWVLLGFVVLLLAYFGVKLVKELLLGR